MADEPKVATEEAPAAPPKLQQVLPSVFQRFDGGELPGFLKSWSDDGPKKVDIAEIAEESELSKDQIKSELESLPGINKKIIEKCIFSSQRCLRHFRYRAKRSNLLRRGGRYFGALHWRTNR